MTAAAWGPAETEGEGPWEARWRWSTGLRGADRFLDENKVITFCEEMFRRADPPELDVSISVRNRETGEGLRDYLHRCYGEVPDSVLVHLPEQWQAPDTAACGTCGGTGRITIIQTGKQKACTRCRGTGKE
ncbi:MULTISPECIES: hypothetical protein [Thermomonosporaceae]|uniref:hypothetical protein n=1 Tax=Thermomonosporaceae TaxID=2012 RepID=UPI00255AA0D1|nr:MULTISPECIES: hypothetical protein [Thermomonosporaceae]MDL4775941.1 hypothetical protein [Actinomadura xylanilytica]